MYGLIEIAKLNDVWADHCAANRKRQRTAVARVRNGSKTYRQTAFDRNPTLANWCRLGKNYDDENYNVDYWAPLISRRARAADYRVDAAGNPQFPKD